MARIPIQTDAESVIQAFEDVSDHILRIKSPVELAQNGIIGLAAIMSAIGGVEIQLRRIADALTADDMRDEVRAMGRPDVN
jgi:hypothetical protein